MMRLKNALPLLPAIFFLLLPAIAPSLATPLASPPALTLTNQDNGKTIAVTSGKTLQITLPENPTTGFTWAILNQPAKHLQLLESTYQADQPQRMGSGGQRQFTFLAKQPGQFLLTLRYRRPWEPAAQFAQEFTLTINVKK